MTTHNAPHENSFSSLAFLALGCALHAAPATATDTVDTAAAAIEDQSTIVVTGIRGAMLESPKATASLKDTPQTITVISDQVLRKQNLLTLRDVLQTVPGITFGAGEGGGGYGDSINLRGYSANNDITQDGVRDSAQYSRTDPFNLQQIEVYNGANSVFNGSGSVGGTINIVSKTPQAGNLTVLNGGIGTDNYYRGTIDTNIRASELIAVRLNAMIHRNDVPGRDVERFKRWGIAPSLIIGVEGPTSLTLAYLHQEDDNTPVFGVPYFKSLVNNGPLPEADRSDYFGIENLDEQIINVDRLTATVTHAFSDSVTFRNLSRWQRVAQDTVTSAPQGIYCLTGTGRQPVGADGLTATGLACPATLLPGQYLPSGPRGLVRDQVNELLVNQADLRIVSGAKGAIRNTLVIGASWSEENYSIESGSLIRDAAGVAQTLPQLSIANINTIYTGPNNRTVTSIARSRTTNKAVYAFDTLELGPMFELNGAVRYENNKARFNNVPLAIVPPGTTALTPAQAADQFSDETLFSYRVGAVFKPVEAVSLYAAYGNAKTPSSATVRLGCGVPATPGAADPCATAPETAKNYEIGAKADLFGRKLQLTAALFRNERSNFRTPSNDPALPTSLQVLDGRSRVDGLALGVSGTITPEWTIFANYTYLDSKVVQSVSDFCLARPGGTGCGNSAANPDPQAGNTLIQTPRHSGSLFTSYRLPFGLELGYGLTYQGSIATNQSSLANPTQFEVDDYLTHRAFLSYPVTPGLTMQVNIQNLTNEKYFTGVRNNVSATTGAVTGGWAVPGDARSAVLNVFYSF